ncbi:MAG: prolyl oligopeptidase family serine peptidase, partial [Myxococcota bacterium]
LPGRTDVKKRMNELLFVERHSAPVKRANRWFFSIKPADKEKTIFYWKEGEDGERRVLLDPNQMSDDGSLSLTTVVSSPKGRYVAFLEQADNADESVLKVMEVATGKMLPDTIAGLRYTAPSWTPDEKGFFYTWIPSDKPANEKMAYGEIRYHRLGTDPSADEVYRGKTGDARRWPQASVSEDGRWLILDISFGWAENDVYVMRLGDSSRRWRTVAEGTSSLYRVEVYNDVVYISSNLNAPRWEVYTASPDRLARKHWRRIIAEDAEAVLDDLDIVGGRLGLRYLRKASSELQLRGLDGTLLQKIELPGIGSTSGFVGKAEDAEAFVSFSSFNDPGRILKVDTRTGKTSPYRQVKVNLDPSRFVVTQKEYPSKDGTKVSMFIIHKKGLPKNGRNPTILYGYGGFNVSLTPVFDAMRIPWLERGGVWAIPNLRGGGEYGEGWHQGGMLGQKQNVFDDFIAAAEFLIADKYTSSKLLGIRGRSNGGLLVGAAMTQRPELYGAVVCGVPLLDMVRYHKFGIGRAWIPEYGSADDPAQFEWLYAYSPYHRVNEGVAYPPLLMLSADHDDRVDPMHARKFVAAVAHATSSKAAPILRIETQSGHGGGDLRSKYADRAADILTFFEKTLE